MYTKWENLDGNVPRIINFSKLGLGPFLNQIFCIPARAEFKLAKRNAGRFPTRQVTYLWKYTNWTPSWTLTL